MWIPKHFKSRRRGRFNAVEYQLVCPKCGKDNLWWVPKVGGGICWSCHAVGDGRHNESSIRSLFRDFVQEHEIMDLVYAMTVEADPRSHRQRLDKVHSDWESHWRSRWYLTKHRRVASEDIGKVGIWYEQTQDVICVPIQRIDGTQLRGDVGDNGAYMSRSTVPEIKNWRAQPAGIPKDKYWFNPVPISDSIILVEGIFDVLSPGLLGRAIGLLGTQLYEDAEYWLMAHRPRELFVWLDPDEAGKNATIKILKQLRGLGGCQVYPVFYEKEPGDCEFDEVMGVLENIR